MSLFNGFVDFWKKDIKFSEYLMTKYKFLSPFGKITEFGSRSLLKTIYTIFGALDYVIKYMARCYKN